MSAAMMKARSAAAVRPGQARASAVKVNAIFKTAVKPAPVKQAANGKAGTGRVLPGPERFRKSTGLEAPKVNGLEFPVRLGFTKENELSLGRLAMLGFASNLIGEIITGKGALAQFGFETGLNITEVDGFVLALIVFNLIAAILPTSQTFVPDEQEAIKERPAGPLQDPTISILDWQRFFGVTSFGFTRANELFVGRVAQLGFAFSLIGEALTGQGALAQFGVETGIPLQDTEFGLLALISFFLLAAVNEGTGRFVDEENN